MTDNAACLREICRFPLSAQIPGLMQYNPQLDSRSSILLFVELRNGNRYALKTPRDEISATAFVTRIKQLDDRRLRREAHPELALPMLVGPQSKVCTAQPFVTGKSFLSQCRWRVRPPADRLLRMAFRLVSSAASVDIGAIDKWRLSSGWVRKCAAQTERPYRTGLVHNDLVPINIIETSGGDIRLIDWDEMDFAPSVFNLYEATLALGSLLIAGFLGRRTIGQYVAVFPQLRDGVFASVRQAFCELHERLQPRSDGVAPAEAFNAFLDYKTCLTGGARDNRWIEISRHRAEMASTLEELMWQSK